MTRLTPATCAIAFAAALAVLPATQGAAQALCESPAPSRFDSRVFGGGGATVFDMAAQYQARRTGGARAGGDVFVAGTPRAAAGGISAGDLLGGLTAAAGVATAIQGMRNGGTVAPGSAQRPRTVGPGRGTCGQIGSEVACSR